MRLVLTSLLLLALPTLAQTQLPDGYLIPSGSGTKAAASFPDPAQTASAGICTIPLNTSTNYTSCLGLPGPNEGGTPALAIFTMSGKKYRMLQWSTGAAEFATGLLVGTGIMSPSVGACLQVPVATGASITAGYRLWVGFTDSTLSSADTPPALSNVCALRFSTGAGDTKWQAFSSQAGTTTGPTTMSTVVAVSTLYLLTVCMNMDPVSNKATASAQCSFYVGVPGTTTDTVTISTNIPTSALDLGGISYQVILDNPAPSANKSFFSGDKYIIKYPPDGV